LDPNAALFRLMAILDTLGDFVFIVADLFFL
jgi:hypothetical protein